MVECTQTRNEVTIGNYQEHTDKYFLRSKQILEVEEINPLVRYQVFARQDIDSLSGIGEAVEFVKSVAGDRTKVYALRDGMEYVSGEPIMKIEGRAQDLIDLETVYLEILSGNLTGLINTMDVREKAKAIIQASEGKPTYYFGTRHFHYNLDEELSRICQEEGFAGCSTDIGAKAWNSKGMGTIPHSLILSYTAHMKEGGMFGNPTLETARAFDRNIDSRVPRTVLIDTFNREISDSVETAKNLTNLSGVRIDTCGENYSQGSREVELPELDVDSKYLDGKGVTIASVWALRGALDKFGFGNLEITVSSGFDEKKTAAFVKADRSYQERYGKPLFDSIGTGSLAKPVMTTSDIVAYYSEREEQWLPLSKKGRGETLSKSLEEVK